MSFAGTQLGRYQLHRVLGSGGMGEVYLAEDRRINRQVAIKVVRSNPDLHPESESSVRALFEREMEIISQLDHPHILPLYDYGEAEVNGATITYMVMPYRPEGSLSTWWRQRKSREPLAPQDVAAFIGQAASALHHAHERQVIHQDVKPSNFLIRVRSEEPEYPDLLLTDFGISRFATAHSYTSHTIRGTPIYMAPEQWQGQATCASDQYALAIMAYELLVGHPPFAGRPESLMFKHINEAPSVPSSLSTALSPDIDAVLLRALAKKPEERFASITDFASAFSQASIGELPTTTGSRQFTLTPMSNIPGSPSALPSTPPTPLPVSAVMSPIPAISEPSPTPAITPSPPPMYDPLRTDQNQPPRSDHPCGGQPNSTAEDWLSLQKPDARPSLPAAPAVVSTISRRTMPPLPSSKVRIVLIVLALLLIGTSGGLFYSFVIAANAAPNTLHASHPTRTAPGGHTAAAMVQGSAIPATQTKPTPTKTAPVLAGNNLAMHAQANPTATALANASATAAANATAAALANANATATATVLHAAITPLYRLVSTKTGDHFYTTSAPERDNAVATFGYRYEGIAAYVLGSQVANSIPLYRLYNGKTGDHFYTTSAPERDNAIATAGYQYETIAAYVYSTQVANTAPLYRLVNAKTGDHFYTLSAPERDNAIATAGYQYEGIACYVYSS